MIHYRAGFSLIEFLVYFSVMTMLAGLSMSSFMHFFSYAQYSEQSTLMVSSLTSAHDLLTRDIALRNNVAGSTEKVFRVGSDDIRWCVREKKLIREKGVYDYVHQRWNKKRDNVVADGIEVCEISLQGNLWKSELAYHLHGIHYRDIRYIAQRSTHDA